MVYFDTSFVAPLLLQEKTSNAVENFVGTLHDEELAVSHWTLVEFASLVGRLVRTGEIDGNAASKIAAVFDETIRESFQVVPPRVADYETARTFLQHAKLNLRGGDALHLAIAQNRNASTLYTLDIRMLRAAHALRIAASSGPIRVARATGR